MAINLLPESERLSSEELVIQSRLRQTSLGFLIFYFVIVLGVFGYWLYWNRREVGTEVKIAEAQSQLAGLRVAEGSLRLIKNKLAYLSQLTEGKMDLGEVWKELSDMASDVEITELSIIGSDVTIGGLARDTSSLSTFEGKLEGQKLYANIHLVGLARTTDGYSFSLKMKKS